MKPTHLGTMKQNKNATIMRSIGAIIRGDLSLPVSIRAPIVAEKNMGAIPSAGKVLVVTIPWDRIKGTPSRNASIVIMRSWRLSSTGRCLKSGVFMAARGFPVAGRSDSFPVVAEMPVVRPLAWYKCLGQLSCM
jgi:hypothetical protein